MSFSAAIESPTLSPVYTLELTGKVLLNGWLVHSADAYKRASTYSFTDVQWNSDSLIARASIVLVEANDGSYFQDTDGTVYVNPPTGEDIYSATVQGEVLYTFSKGATKVFDSKQVAVRTNALFEARVLSIPALSLRIEPRFSGVGQIGGGNCELSNGDGFFDDIPEVDWDRAFFYMGADTSAAAMPYSDFQPLGSYAVEDWKADRMRFTLTLKEPKAALSQEIPIETLTRAAYPNISQNDIGKIIPRIYGRVFSATPICVDVSAKRFKICGHAVYEISEAKIKSDNAWISVPFASRDEANGEFTLGAEWDSSAEVCVDLIGVKNADGTPMYNWSDIVLDLLQYIGETDFDSASFTAAHAALTVGTYPLTGQENTVLKGSLYIDSATSVLDLISAANNAAGSFLYVNQSGQWHYEVFTPKRLSDVAATYTDDDVLLNSFQKLEETRDVFSKVSVKFAKRNAENWSENIVKERSENQYRIMSASAILKEIDVPLFDEHDAIYYAERILTTDAEPLARFTIAVKWRGLLRKPGDQIAINYSAQGIAGIFEVLEARHDLNTNRVTLVCGDRRAWQDSFGFWVADATASWNAAGTSTEKRESKENSGFWHGDDSLADSTDSDSYATSKWF